MILVFCYGYDQDLGVTRQLMMAVIIELRLTRTAFSYLDFTIGLHRRQIRYSLICIVQGMDPQLD